jgi:HK97 family phage major capsid protein
MSDYIKQQFEARQRAWEEAKELLDNAAAEKRDLTAEETSKYENISADLDRRAQVIEDIKKDMEREERANESMRGLENQAKPTEVSAINQTENDKIRSLARGEVRGLDFEHRDVLKSSTGSPVPTSFYDQIVMLARHIGPMLETSLIINTASGENLQVPSLNTYSASTAFGEGVAIGESDPVFNSFRTLSAYKYGHLIQVSRELIEDAGVDLIGFLASQTGNALGFKINEVLTLGTGSTEPNGLVNRAGSGITGAGGTVTADNIIDLVYSVDTAGRTLPGVGFQMKASTIAAVRKLKDNSGQYLFSPSLSADDRDMLLGYRIFENPAMAAVGSGVVSIVFGHLPSYFVRQVGGIRLDRSDDFAFANDLVTFRATVRLDGDLIQTSHVKWLKTS